MILSEPAEEILEALWQATEVSKGRSVSISGLSLIPSTEVMEELKADNIIIELGNDTLEITDHGYLLARDAVRRHRLAERLLTDVLAVKTSMVQEAACQFEHHLHKGIDESVCTLLGHPHTCPHGNPIPEGECCKKHFDAAAPIVTPMANLEPGQKGHVAYLHTSDPKHAQMLISMGLVPGTELKLLSGYPSFLFQVGGSQFAVDKTIASEIFLRIG